MNYKDYRYLHKDLVSNDGYSRRKMWLRIIDEIREDLEYEKIYYHACDGLEIELEFRTAEYFCKNEFSAPHYSRYSFSEPHTMLLDKIRNEAEYWAYIDAVNRSYWKE